MFKKETKEILSITTQMEKNAIIDFLETAEGDNVKLVEKAYDIKVQYLRDECNDYISELISLRNAMKEYCNNRHDCNNCPLEGCSCEVVFEDDEIIKFLEDMQN